MHKMNRALWGIEQWGVTMITRVEYYSAKIRQPSYLIFFNYSYMNFSIDVLHYLILRTYMTILKPDLIDIVTFDFL